jgi:hypothetical protein
VKWSLKCDEASLRDVFQSLGGEAGNLMLDAVEGGVVVEVTSGSKAETVTDREAVLKLLRKAVGWSPEGPQGPAQVPEPAAALPGETEDDQSRERDDAVHQALFG